MGYTKDVVKGVSWYGFLRFLTKGIGFIEILILARILTPSQYGAYGIALFTLGFLETVTETGVNIVLLQEDEIDHYLSSAWMVSIVRGFLIFLVLFFLTPFISSFFHSPESKQLLYLISLVPIFRGFINPAVVKFQKNLDFHKNFFYQGIIVTADTLFSVAFTYYLKNPIGIGIGLLVGTILELMLSFIVIKPRPNFSFNYSYVKIIFHRGKWVTGAGIFEYAFQNTDNIVVGRMLGPTSLGIYGLAYSIAVVPLLELGSIFSYVNVPILVRISNDYSRFKQAFLKTLLVVILLSLPVCLFLILFPQIVPNLLGERWLPTVAVIPVLAVLGLLKAIFAVSNSAFLGTKNQKYTTTITLINIIILLVLIVPLVSRYGMVGAGASATSAAIISLPVLVYLVIKTLRGVKSTGN